jgi:hypothetical protein
MIVQNFHRNRSQANVPGIFKIFLLTTYMGVESLRSLIGVDLTKNNFTFDGNQRLITLNTRPILAPMFFYLQFESAIRIYIL